MAKYCPVLNQKVVYLTCLECEEKLCKQAGQNEKTTDASQKSTDEQTKPKN
jgi:hypothetical protein